MTTLDQPSGSRPKPGDWFLVVDDDKPICDLIINALSSESLEVVAAEDAASAMEILARRETEPLVVLTDVLMPGMDGLTFSTRLRSRLKKARIVIMSGHLTDASWWPMALRDITFLTKPFRMDELIEIVELAKEEANPGA